MRQVLPLLVGLLAPLIALAEPGPVPREVRFDRDGDRLPDGALARLGSRRFRDPGADRLFVWDSGKVVACFNEATVRWWDLQSGHYLRGWAAPGGGQTWFSPDGRVAAVASSGRIEVWDAWNDRRLRAFEADTTGRVVAAVSPDGRTVAVGTNDWNKPEGRLRVWDVATGAERLAGELEYYAEDLHFADGGRLLIVLPVDTKAVAWDLEKRAVQWRLSDRDRFRLDRQGRWFAAEVGRDAELVFHDATTGRPVKDTVSLPRLASASDLADISPDGRTLLINSEDGFLWDRRRSVEENQSRQFRLAEGPYPRAWAFFPDGRRVVVAMGQRLEVFDAATRKRLSRDLPDWGQPGRIGEVGWSADGRQVITWAPDGAPSTCAWDPTSGRRTGAATEQDYLSARRRDPAAFVGAWSAEDRLRGPVPRDTTGHWLPPNGSRTITADRALMAGAQRRGTRIVDPPEDREARLGIRCRPVYRELKVEDPSVVEVWTGRPLVSLRIRYAKDLALSPDGRSLAVGEPDGIHLYDILTSRELLVRKIPAYPRPDPTAPAEFGLSFSPDGTRLAVIEAGGSVLVFDVSVSRERSPLKPGEFDKLWADLASDDPRTGWAAIHRLCDDAAAGAGFLTQRIAPVAEPAGLAALIQDLNSPSFRAREAAAGRLLAFGDAARPAVTAALKARSEGESRERLERLAANLTDDRPPQAADLQRLRALVVLERANTPEARAKVREVAHGMSDARVTREAKRAAARLADANWDR
jgi:WD40 repeat protein